MFDRLRARSQQDTLMPHANQITESEFCVAPTQINTAKCEDCSEVLIQKDTGVLRCPECGMTTCSFDMLADATEVPSYHYRKGQYLALILQYLQGLVGNREDDPPHWVLEGTCKALAAKKVGLMEMTVQDVANALESLTNPETGEKAKKYIKVRVRIFFLITNRERPTLTHSAIDQIKTVFTNVVCGPFKSLVQNKKDGNFDNYTRYCQMSMITYRHKLALSLSSLEPTQCALVQNEIDNLDHFQRLRVFEVPNNTSPAKTNTIKSNWLKCINALNPDSMTMADLDWDSLLSRKRKTFHNK